MNREILFILNPVSGFGKRRRRKIRQEIVRQIRYKGLNADIAYSKFAGHGSEIAKKAVEQGYKTVVVAGGDGSINEVAKELVGTDVAFSVIPAGSGNGFARSIKMPFNIKKSLSIIKKRKVQSADILKVNDKFAFSVAGIGFDAEVANEYAKSKSRGILSYFRAMLKTYFHFKAKKVKIFTDEIEVEATVFSVVFANANQFGYNYKIAPKASVFDGYMDIVLIKPFPLLAFVFTSLLVFLGFAGKSRYVTIISTKQNTVMHHITDTDDFSDKKIMNIDGNALPTDDEVFEVTILEKSLNLII